jgi:2'-5' RNA ligase
MTAAPVNYRLFIAIELPQPTIDALTKLQNQLRRAQAVRWVRPTQMHLTLQFLGDVAVANIDRLSAALNKTIPPNPAFTLSIEGLGAFPNLKRPRVVWAGVGGELKQLTQLHQATIDATQTIGIQPEDRPFNAHLTLGRANQKARSLDYQQLSEVLSRYQSQVGQLATFSVEHVSLIRSQLQPDGHIYTTLAEIELGSTGLSA